MTRQFIWIINDSKKTCCHRCCSATARRLKDQAVLLAAKCCYRCHLWTFRCWKGRISTSLTTWIIIGRERWTTTLWNRIHVWLRISGGAPLTSRIRSQSKVTCSSGASSVPFDSVLQICFWEIQQTSQTWWIKVVEWRQSRSTTWASNPCSRSTRAMRRTTVKPCLMQTRSRHGWEPSRASTTS